MVVALGPGKFYGSSLPRPRFYTDIKHSDQRVDPPPSVMDPLLAWAQEAHWSMGGLSFKRHRLQGRIEGNIEKLRVQREQTFKRSPDLKKSVKKSTVSLRDEEEADKTTPSPPPAPVAIKRRRVVGLVDEDVEDVVVAAKRGPVRKLGDDFERVARESGMKTNPGGGSPAARTRSKSSETNVSGNENEEGTKQGKKKLVKGGRKIGSSVVAAAAGIRSSPRLSKTR